MDKETLIRLATPASIFALALSIATLPFIANAYGPFEDGGKYNPLHVKIVQ